MEEVRPLLTGPFAGFLKANREQLNARFAKARRAQPTLDGAAFLDVLRDSVRPIVDSVDQVQPDRTAAVADTLYSLALDLLGEDILSGKTRYPFVVTGWRDLFPALAKAIAAAPRAVAGSLTNALYNLSLVPGARAGEWIETMRALGPRCADTSTLLKLGQVAAWHAGLAHYRKGALAACRQLDSGLVRAALRIPDPAQALATHAILNRIAADPWFDPATLDPKAERPKELKLVARAGAFRGFGGLFVAPPTVRLAAGHFVAHDGDSRWLLTADVFGATFHRTEGAAGSPGSGPFQVDRSGKVTLGKTSKVFAELADFSSVAADETTLAVTTPLSHAVYLVALA